MSAEFYSPVPPAPAPVPAGTRTEPFAVVALCTGLGGFVFGWPSILGIVFGFLALARIKRDGTAGRGMALAGVITGFAGLGLGVVVVILVVLYLGLLSSAIVNSPTPGGVI